MIVVHVFISYASPDRAIADEVASWLRAEGHEPFLAHDLRNGIGVVTSSFVASPWCSAELGTRMRGVVCSYRCELRPALSIR